MAARGRLDDDLDYFLGGLGIAPVDEHLYRALLRNGAADLGELSRLTGVGPGALRRAVARLERDGLVSRLSGRRLRLVATSPQVAVGALAARREEEIARARGSIDILAEETRQGSESPEELLEIVTGQDAVGRNFRQLNLSARTDVRALVRPPFASDVTKAPVSQNTALDRGVDARSIYDVSAFETPGLLDAARELVDQGEQARVGTVPIKLIIVDSAIAMLPLTSGDRDAAQSAVVVHRSTLLDALIWLFEMIWREAAPLRWTDEQLPRAGDRIGGTDAEILSMLCAGLKDEAVARQLGVSLRTLQRRLSELFAGLGARTRFQAGYAVAQHHALDSVDRTDESAGLTQPVSRTARGTS